jgi:hypothetical protein
MLRNRIAAAVAAVLASAAPALAGDVIQRTSGQTIPPTKSTPPSPQEIAASGFEVLAADASSVSYTMPGTKQPQRLAASDVAEIYLDQKKYPPQWREGEQALASGNYVKAAADFRAVGESATAHVLIRQRAWLKHLLAIREAGSPAQIHASMEAAEKAFPNSFYQRSLLREYAVGLREAGDEAGAAAAADRLEKLPGVPESDRTWTRLLRLSVGYRKAVNDNDPAALRKSLEEAAAVVAAAGSKPDMAEVALQARLMQANCMLALKDTKNARAIFEDISERATAAPVLAEAFNGLGECLVAEGGKENVDKARFHFLRVSTMYTEGTPGEELARALVRTADCFYRLQDTPEWPQRVMKEARELVNRFPKSRYRDEANSLMTQASTAAKAPK